MKCIFCMEDKNEKEFSDEHVFPYAIGGSLVIRTVCKECNSHLGDEVDCKMTENFIIKIVRLHYKIRNRDGNICHPFDNLVEENTERKVKYCIDNKTGEPKAPYFISSGPSVIDDKIWLELDYRDRDKAKGIIEKFCKRNGYTAPSEEMFKEMLKNVKPKSSRPTLVNKFVIDCDGIARAMLKIIYELSCYWLGEEYLKDDIAAKIRNYILHRAKNDVHGSVYPAIRCSKCIPYQDGTHCAFLMVSRNNIYAVARIFNCIEAVVLVTERANEYDFTEDNAPCIVLDAINRKKEEGLFLDTLFRRIDLG